MRLARGKLAEPRSAEVRLASRSQSHPDRLRAFFSHQLKHEACALSRYENDAMQRRAP